MIVAFSFVWVTPPMAADTSQHPSPIAPRTFGERWRLLRGDRFYAAARWLVIVLLIGISGILTNEPIWPPFASTHPVSLAVWMYAIFNLLVVAALFIRQLHVLLDIAFYVDLLIVTLLISFTRNQVDLFYPLYILPLVGASLQRSQRGGMLIGALSAVAYTAANVYAALEDGGRFAMEATAIVGLVLRAAVLFFIPWLVSNLAERWSDSNRMSVTLAERKTREALNEADDYRDQTRALYEVAYTLATTANYQNVLDVTLVESRKLAPHTCGIVLLSSGEENQLFVAAAQGLGDEDRRCYVTIGPGALNRVLQSNKAALVADVSQEPELKPISALARCKAACVVPLRSGLDTFGVIVVANERPNTFDEEQLGKLAALANYALVALQNAQLIHDLRTERNKLLSKEEEVRQQLARDLHDGPAQSVASITMSLEFIKRLLERDPDRVRPELERLSTLSKQTNQEIRTKLFELRPLALETQGLPETLRQYFERFRGTLPEIVQEYDGFNAKLEVKVEGALFNIIQEAVNNARKHSRAGHIWVRLRENPETIEAIVQDDGVGFDLEKVKESYSKRGSYGLLNLNERASLVGGTCDLSSQPGKGTTVHVVVPIHH